MRSNTPLVLLTPGLHTALVQTLFYRTRTEHVTTKCTNMVHTHESSSMRNLFLYFSKAKLTSTLQRVILPHISQVCFSLLPDATAVKFCLHLVAEINTTDTFSPVFSSLTPLWDLTTLSQMYDKSRINSDTSSQLNPGPGIRFLQLKCYWFCFGHWTKYHLLRMFSCLQTQKGEKNITDQTGQ